MAKTAKVKENSDLIRDLSNNAVINNNHRDYKKRLLIKRNHKQRDQEIKDLRSQLEELKQLIANK